KRDESHTKEESNVFKEWEDESKTETSDQNGAVLKNSMSSKKPYWAQKNLKKNGTGKKKKGKFWSFITGQGVH
ncbi:MAG: hypothetical protein U9O82_03900, partial [Thermodesulfobacteriota bacterium]|nr:hypothetical protein [Thermodesulfobacteriota bacterium]